MARQAAGYALAVAPLLRQDEQASTRVENALPQFVPGGSQVSRGAG